jgi:hypothetical protein
MMRVAAGLLLMVPLLLAGGVAQATPGDYCSGRGSGYFCLYQHGNFGGRVQSFSSCGEYNLNYWDEASSWKHQQYGIAGVTVFNYAPGTPTQLWSMQGDLNSSSQVAANHNDKADYVINYC